MKFCTHNKVLELHYENHIYRICVDCGHNRYIPDYECFRELNDPEEIDIVDLDTYNEMYSKFHER